jgi:hypothetical protein
MSDDFRKGSSVTFEVSNKPYVDRTVTPSLNDYRNASYAWIKIYDPCDNIFVDCPMTPCQDRIGWYLYRLQTDDQFPLGQYKVDITLTNVVPESSTACTSGTSGDPGISGTPSPSGTPTPDYLATSRGVKYFRLISDDVR